MVKKKIAFLWFVSAFICAFSVFMISKPVSAMTSVNCETVRNSLKMLQKTDARARVNLGARYETILTKYITPLNIRLVENNLSNAELVENQNNFVETRRVFSSDFIKYQRGLEELVGMNCKEDPDLFYNKLVVVRQKRKIMEQDVLKMREIIAQHVKLVNALKGKL